MYVFGVLFISEGLGGGIDFTYRTISRGCVSVDMLGSDVPKYADGCHTGFPPRKSLRKVLTQGYSGLDVEDVQFKGKVCYNDDSFMAESKPEAEPQKPEVTSPSLTPPRISEGQRLSSPMDTAHWLVTIALCVSLF